MTSSFTDFLSLVKIMVLQTLKLHVRINPVYIASQESLEAFVERARSSSVLAIDTEFLREKTYYAKLCLLQLATDDEVAIVDPFEVDRRFSP